MRCPASTGSSTTFPRSPPPLSNGSSPPLRVLVVGGGAREHALVWKLHQSPQVTAVFAAPGNAGISLLAETFPVPVSDIEGLKRLAIQNKIELTIVGPENPLADGIVDSFQKSHLAVFGPTQAAARLES